MKLSSVPPDMWLAPNVNIISILLSAGMDRGVRSLPAGCASLDLASGKADRQVSDEAVLGLSRPVAGHDTPASLLGHLHCHDGLCHRSNLVHLQKPHQRCHATALCPYLPGVDPDLTGRQNYCMACYAGIQFAGPGRHDRDPNNISALQPALHTFPAAMI